jgi:hypothetical protein
MVGRVLAAYAPALDPAIVFERRSPGRLSRRSEMPIVIDVQT